MRPILLFVSPVPPRASGSGVRMRAALQIAALSRFFDVDLTVIRSPASPVGDDIDPEIAALCRRTFVVTAEPSGFVGFYEMLKSTQLRLFARALHPKPMSSAVVSRHLPRLDAFARETDYAVVYAFRLWTAPFALSAASHMPRDGRRLVVDFDDIESEFARRQARTMRAESGLQIALLTAFEAGKLRRLERRAIRGFDTVCVCSGIDRDKLRAAHPEATKIAIVPNVVRDPGGFAGTPAEKKGRPPVLLFVGSLDYLPNIDGLIHLAGAILPRLREIAGAPFELRVVGRSPGPEVKTIAAQAGLTLIADAESPAPHYRDAAAVLVPLRLGGGTRIKILEAFSYGRAVISTSIGAEGIEAEHGRNILIADDPTAFARHCVELMARPDQARRVAMAGRDLFERSYSPAALERVFAAMFGIKGPGPAR